MYRELKRAIVEWLLDNPNVFNRQGACFDRFRQYIYDEDGNYIIGGEIVADFIREADVLINRERGVLI